MAHRDRGMEERENVFGECNAMAGEELWSGWNQVEKTGPQNQPRKLEEAEALNQRRRVGGSPTFYAQMKPLSYDFSEEGHRVELGEEHCWTTVIEGSNDFQ